MTFRESNPNILFSLTNFGLDLSFNYSLTTIPEFYKDIGSAIVNVAPFNMTFGMDTKVVNGTLQTDITLFSYDFDDYSIDFSGNGDLSFLLLTIADSFKVILKSDLSPNILVLMQSLVEPAINDLFLSLGTQMEVEDLVVDYTFIDYPQYKDNDFALFIKGEVRPVDEPNLPFEDDRWVPAHSNATGGDIQVFISDYVIHSLLYSVYKTELLALRVTDNPLSAGSKLKVGDVTLLFPDLVKTYPKSTPLYFEIRGSSGFNPLFKIEKGETYLTLRLDLIMGVTPNEETDDMLFDILTEANMTLNYGLEDGVKIAASISSFKYKVVKILYDTVGLDESDINAILGMVTGIARNFVNYALDAIDVPIPELPIIDINLNKTYIYERDGYLLFDTTPRFKLKANRVKYTPPPFDRALSFRNQVSTHATKVDMFKRLIKATPLMGILNEAKKYKKYTISPELVGRVRNSNTQNSNCKIEQDEKQTC